MSILTLYDTTLRDGTQGEGISLSVADKLAICQRLDELGVHYIEGGWPGSNPRDAEFFERAKSMTLCSATLTASAAPAEPTSAPQRTPTSPRYLKPIPALSPSLGSVGTCMLRGCWKHSSKKILP